MCLVVSPLRSFAAAKLFVFLYSPLFFFVPYFEREDSRFSTPPKSLTPRTLLYFTPGKSRTRPPRTLTVECSCNPCSPSPGIYTILFFPVTLRLFVTLRCAEFGFFGAFLYTFIHTPRFCGFPFNAGLLFFFTRATRSFVSLCRLVPISFSLPYSLLLFSRLLSA